MGDWTLFSNHGHVLVCLARNREARLRDVASDIGITERAVQKIVHELQSAGFVSISKHGRCNRYEINTRKNLRHALEANCTVGQLLQLFSRQAARGAKHAASEQDAAETPRAEPPVAQKTAAAPARPKAPAVPATDAEKAGAPDKRTTGKGEPGSREPDSRNQGSLF